MIFRLFLVDSLLLAALIHDFNLSNVCREDLLLLIGIVGTVGASPVAAEQLADEHLLVGLLALIVLLPRLLLLPLLGRSWRLARASVLASLVVEVEPAKNRVGHQIVGARRETPNVPDILSQARVVVRVQRRRDHRAVVLRTASHRYRLVIAYCVAHEIVK